MTEYKNRIVELIRVPASELTVSAKNYRTHDDRQRSALNEVMRIIGFADALIAYRSGGHLVLINGHLRQSDVDQDTILPVLVVDLTDEEADVALASYDAISAMAETNWGMLVDLADKVEETWVVDLDLIHGGNLNRMRELAVVESIDDNSGLGGEVIRFGKWKLPIGCSQADVLDTSIAAYVASHGSAIGYGMVILDNLP